MASVLGCLVALLVLGPEARGIGWVLVGSFLSGALGLGLWGGRRGGKAE